MIGLKRGTVALYNHEKEWEIEAKNAIEKLKNILKDVIKCIEHIGSTSIKSIKAKPIIDIVLAVNDFNNILSYEKELRSAGFYYCPDSNIENQLLFACGSFYEGTGDLQTHFIHIVLTESTEWEDYINFRDYLNNTPTVRKEYENLKISLAMKNPVDNARAKYLEGKHDFIIEILKKCKSDKTQII